MNDRPNIPPADELFQTRTAIKALQEREKFLRETMLSDPSARTGNYIVAEIKEISVSRPDLKALRAEYPAIVAEHTYSFSERRVELRAIDEDGVITPIRSK